MRLIKAIALTLLWYLFNIAYVFLDVGINVLIGGHRDETISSRCGKGKLAGKPVHTVIAYLIDCLFFWEDDHCVKHIQPGKDVYSISSLWDKFYNASRKL